MSIKFVSHEEFPDDNYTKELVYLELDGKYRVAYVRKESKNGGKFWTPVTLALTEGVTRVYRDAFMIDSNFLQKDILRFLETKPWEKVQQSVQAPSYAEISDGDVPF